VTFADAGTLVSCSSDKTARAWDVAKGEEARRFTGHSAGVFTVAVSGGKLYTSSDDKTSRVWDLASGKQLAELPKHRNGVYAVAVSADGKRVATAGKDRVIQLFPDGAPVSRK
jgi:WD40 repeat protein